MIYRCPATLYLIEFRLVPFRSPLLRESLLLSFPLVTKMFQFTRFALSSLVYSRSSSRSFLIRVFSDQNLLPVPRNISLVATPFIASEHQGIRRKPLFAWLSYFNKSSIILCNVYLLCGDKRIRTADICRAKAALYQLSYTPNDGPSRIWTWDLTLIRGAL